MIYIYTGSNGSGKTLCSIKFICEVLNPNNNRPVYYFNAPSQPLNPNPDKIGDWEEISKDQAQNWMSFPPGSIFLIDEFRHVFPYRTNNVPIPDFVDALSEHRSKGFDFVLTAQKPTAQFDPAIQGFCEEHRHMYGLSGSKRCRHLIFDAYCSTPFEPPKLLQPKVETLSFDKKYFDYYKSASLHTSVNRLPYKKLLVIPLLFLLLSGLIWVLYNSMSSLMGTDSSAKSPDSVSPSSVVSSASNFLPAANKVSENDQYISTEKWIELRQPRIPDIPSSAPLYDDLTRPVSYPRIAACVDRPKTNTCTCYTQQGTPLQISTGVCKQYVRKGSFDYSIPDQRSYQIEQNHSSGLGRPAAGRMGLPAPAANLTSL